MATSIQMIGERAEPFDDLDLIALACMLDQEKASRPREYSAFAPLLDGWKQDLETYGPGTIDLKLDRVVSEDRAETELMALLSAVADKLRHYGDTLPASVLNAQCKAPGVRFYDYPTSNLKTTIDRLRAMLVDGRLLSSDKVGPEHRMTHDDSEDDHRARGRL